MAFFIALGSSSANAVQHNTTISNDTTWRSFVL